MKFLKKTIYFYSKDDTERPRDPRLHSSKQLKSQAAQAEAKQAEDQANLADATDRDVVFLGAESSGILD